ncbi:MAG: DUF4040 domain-containing protein [Clostridia bacterium]|nr:DUF4040 domain-containing protein [Clostridia bacterium]
MLPAVEKILYIALIVFAFMTVQTPKLRRAVIYLAVFSATSAFVYVLLGAPDAALAEAVIGSTIATVIYLSALQKYKVFTIYYTNERRQEYRQSNMLRRRNTVLRRMESFCSGKELEAHVLYTTESLDEVFAKQGWDLIVRRKDSHFKVYGMEQNYHVDDLEDFFKEKGKDLIEAGYTIDFIIE